jgi:hypothetical protein
MARKIYFFLKDHAPKPRKRRKRRDPPKKHGPKPYLESPRGAETLELAVAWRGRWGRQWDIIAAELNARCLWSPHGLRWNRGNLRAAVWKHCRREGIEYPTRGAMPVQTPDGGLHSEDP